MNKWLKYSLIIIIGLLLGYGLLWNNQFSVQAAATWTFAEPGIATGINYVTSNNAIDPVMTVYNNELYAAWEEVSGGISQIRVKKYNGGTSWISAGDTNSINKDPTKSAMNPALTAFNGYLYAAWDEYNGSRHVIRVHRYNGSSWTQVDGDGPQGLNRDLTPAEQPCMTVFNNELYIAWMETISSKNYVHVKKSVDGTTWNFVDGNTETGLNCASYSAFSPCLAVWNNQLYISWSEENISGVRQVRVRQYESGNTWNTVDGGNGLNLSSLHNAGEPYLIALNNTLYAAWDETKTDGEPQVHVHLKRYNGTNWAFVDGGYLNRQPGLWGYKPKIAVWNNKAYITWDEEDNLTNYIPQIRVKKYDGTAFSFIDGGEEESHLNYDNTKGAKTPFPVIFNGNLYITWQEPHAGINQIRVKQYPLPAVTTSVTIPAGTYSPANSLDITVNFNKSVSVTGIPYIPITLDTGGTVNAIYVSGTGSTALVFRYTIASGHLDTDGISLGSNPSIILGSSGTIIDQAASLNADLNLNNVADISGVKVDGIAPTVSALSPLDNAVNVGVNDNLVITFSEKVVVGTGNITIRRTSNDSVVEIIDVTSGKVTGWGSNTITIDPATTLAGETGYYIFIDGTAFNDTAGNSYAGISDKTVWNFTSVDMTAPTLVSAVRMNNTTLTVTLSENCININKSNNGGFTVCETGAPGITYAVSSIAQGVDASHVVLTVIDLAVSAKEGVTVKYTAGGNGTVQDMAGNAMATNGVGIAVTAWDTTVPTITSGALAASNNYIDVVLSEGIYGTSTGSGAITGTQLGITFIRNGGIATGAAISCAKKPDNETEAAAAALIGGETTIRVFLSITGNPSGVETVAITPADGASLYDRAGNAMAASQTTGAKQLNPVTLTLWADQFLTETNLANTDIKVDLGGVTLKDNQLSIGNFQLIGAPGLTIQSVTYVDSVHCALRVSGNFSGNLNLGLTIAGAEISNNNPLTSGNTLPITDDLPDGKVTVTVGTGNNRWYTAENYQNDYRTVWNAATLHLGKGTSGRNADLWLYNPGLIGNQTGAQIPTGAKVDRAELVLRIKNISGDLTKPRQIKIYRIIDPDSKGQPYFGSQDGLRTGLNFSYRDHRLGRNIPWSGVNGNITTSISDILDTFEFIPQAYVDGKYNSVRLDISAAVKAWVGDQSLNQGLYLTISGDWNNGEQVEMYGPAATNESNRPQLQVSYLTTGDGSAPVAVTLNVTTLGDRRVILGWNNLGAVVGYRVVRKEGVTPANPGDGILLYDGTATSYDDHNGLENGKIYYYAVYAYNTDRNYGSKAYQRAIPGNYGTVPAAPTGLTYTLVARNISLRWTDNAVNEAEYLVLRDGAQIAALSANQTTYYDWNVPPGSHHYEVRAQNTTGSSSTTSGPVNVPSLPAPPANLRWSIISSSEVQLYWTQVAGETYRVEIFSETGALLRSEPATVDLNSAANEFHYPVMRLIANAGYRFRVVAINGTGENIAETEVVKTAVDPKPIFF